MTAVDRNDVVSFVAGSLYGESPLSLEDAVTGALRLVDEFAEHGWTVVIDERGGEPDDDMLRVTFGAEAVPVAVSVGGTVYDVVPRAQIARELADRFEEVESSGAAGDDEISFRCKAHDADTGERCILPEHDEDEIEHDFPPPIETMNDHMVGISVAGNRLIWLGSNGVSSETALRHAAWIVALADPLQERFPKILRAVMST